MTSSNSKIDLIDDVEVREFFEKYKNTDPVDVSLKLSHLADYKRRFILDQISGYQKSKNKFPFLHNKSDIIFPKAISIEQSSSEWTAKFKASLFDGKKAVDLTGGLGIDSVFLSTKYLDYTLVEQDAELLEITEHNFSVLGRNNVDFINSTSEEFLKTCESQFDLIYIDPDRRAGNNRAVLLEDMTPNVSQLLPRLIECSKDILIKLSPMFDLKELLKKIPEISKVYVVSVDNECKEILIHISEQEFDGLIHCHELGKSPFSYQFEIDAESNIQLDYSEILDYVYLPNASLTKAGAFKAPCIDFEVKKISANTHIYTSSNAVTDFPGKKYRVSKVLPYKKDSSLPSKLNLIIRNFPDDIKTISKKLKVRNGGKESLILYRDSNNRPEICLCELFSS